MLNEDLDKEEGKSEELEHDWFFCDDCARAL